MKKSTLFMILALVLSMAIGLTGTLAYLTDTDEDVNVMTLGNVDIEQIELERVEQTNSGKDELQDYTQGKPLYPAVGDPAWPKDENGQVYQEWPTGGSSAMFDAEKLQNVQDKIVFVENTGKSDAYIRTVFAFELAEGWTVEDVKDKKIHLNKNDINEAPGHYDWEWVETPVEIDGQTYAIATATYIGKDDTHKGGILPAGETSRPSLLQVYMDPSLNNADIESLGETYDILVVSQAVQAMGFDKAQTALDKAFGEITADNNPWKENGENLDGTPVWPVIWDGNIPETMPETMELTPDSVRQEGGVITINDAEALVYLSKLKDDFIAKADEISGYDNYYYHWTWDIELTNDIDLNNIELDTIDISYFGSFNGNGHTIKNVSLKDGSAGLFMGRIPYANVSLANVTINSPSVETVGALTGYAGTLTNVSVKNADIVGKKYVGGIAGKSSSVVGCTITNSVINASDKTVGGMVGYAIGDPNTAVAQNNVVNNVQVTGAYNVGGMFGQAQNIDLTGNTVKESTVTSTTELPSDAGSSEVRTAELAARKHGYYTEAGSTVTNVTTVKQ